MAVVFMQPFFPELLDEFEDFLRTTRLYLYTNPGDVTELDDRSDYLEPLDAWAAPIPLTLWYPAYLRDDGVGEKAHEYITFTFRPPAVGVWIYGYFVVDYDQNVVFAEEDPGGGVYMNNPGQPYVVRPRVTLHNELVTLKKASNK